VATLETAGIGRDRRVFIAAVALAEGVARVSDTAVIRIALGVEAGLVDLDSAVHSRSLSFRHSITIELQQSGGERGIDGCPAAV
jgi:hypothetical protein